jgi:hypothetical protein
VAELDPHTTEERRSADLEACTRDLFPNRLHRHIVYHMVMARREVLVQLDDDLVTELDSLADRLGTNRSALLRRGARAVIEVESQVTADRELQQAYRREPPDPALVQSARRLAAETAPGW